MDPLLYTRDEETVKTMDESAPDEPAPKKAKIVKSIGKVMATVFWDARGINSYRLPSVEANDQWWLLLSLIGLFQHLKKKRPHLAKKKVLFHHDNVRVRTYPAPMAKFNEFRYELLPHPAYSPDLAPCDYFLFPNLKKWFGGKRFITREHLIAETEAYFEELDKSYYSAWKSWRIVGSSVIELKRDYVEKWK